jgi:inhibitor of cysteine peptidase
MKKLGKRRFIVATVLVVVIVGSVVASAGCGGKAGANGASVKLTDADNGKSVTVKVGDTVEVVLTGNPTTGYSWTASVGGKDAAAVKQQGIAVYAQQNTNPSVVGAGGTFTFTFKAAAAGQATLTFDYARPFDKGTPPIKTFTVTVTVK